MAVTFVLGMNGKLYYGNAPAVGEPDAIGAMLVVDNVRDLTVSLESSEADVTTRANAGWRATAQALRECTLEIEMVWKPTDLAFTAMKNAYLNNTLVELAALDGLSGTAGSQGPKGSFSIISFPRTEPLEDGMKVTVSAKLSVWDQWLVI